MAVRSTFICPRRDSSRDPDFTQVPNACVLWPTKQVMTSINKKDNALGKACTRKLPSWTAPIKGGALFGHRRIVSLGKWPSAKSTLHFLCISFSSSMLGKLALCLLEPLTICSSADSVTATRRLSTARWTNLGAMHCQSRPRLQVARQVDLGWPGAEQLIAATRCGSPGLLQNLTPWLCTYVRKGASAM